MPYYRVAWQERANFARSQGDSQIFIACLLSDVDCDPSDRHMVIEAVFEVTKSVNDHLSEIQKDRRSVYLATIREHMMALEGDPDAAGLSRLTGSQSLKEKKARRGSS